MQSSPECFVQDVGRDGKGRELSFPNDGSSGVFWGLRGDWCKGWGKVFLGQRGVQVGCSKAGFLHCWSVGD